MSCRDRFRIELTQNSVSVYVNGKLYLQQSGLAAKDQLPEPFLSSDLYVYFSNWTNRPLETARFHWDRPATRTPSMPQETGRRLRHRPISSTTLTRKWSKRRRILRSQPVTSATLSTYTSGGLGSRCSRQPALPQLCLLQRRLSLVKPGVVVHRTVCNEHVSRFLQHRPREARASAAPPGAIEGVLLTRVKPLQITRARTVRFLEVKFAADGCSELIHFGVTSKGTSSVP